MKKNHCTIALLLALPISGLLAGCGQTNQNTSESNTNTMAMPDTNSMMDTNSMAMPDTNSMPYTNSTTTSGDMNSTNLAADNSGVNVRDRDTNNLTPGDQGETAADVDTTQKIRKELVMDSNYSMTAKNIKIITINGKVTLRGPVDSDSEKTGIETIAQNVAGVGNVENQLEVKSNP